MRRFEGPEGGSWDVVVGRASWGAFQLLFVPDGVGETRQVHLDAASAAEAERTLSDLSAEELREHFRDSRPRED
jgi:hypothetical protein